MPPVVSQGGEGACVAFAVGYAARSAEQYYRTNASSYSNSTNVFSPEFLYNQIKFSSDCCSSTAMQTALDFIKLNGIPTYKPCLTAKRVLIITKYNPNYRGAQLQNWHLFKVILY
jgi:hypothetical protein